MKEKINENLFLKENDDILFLTKNLHQKNYRQLLMLNVVG